MIFYGTTPAIELTRPTPHGPGADSARTSAGQTPHQRDTPCADSRRTPASSSKSAHASANDGVCSPAADHQTPARPKSRYIPALDGLRTLAVVAVVLYHLNLTWAQGGLLGVTIFFVLSGYLITRLLLNEVAKTGRIDLKSFWIRRIRRLFPAVVTVVVVTCALCTIFNHVMLTKMRPDILPSLLFFNNWWQIAQDISYFNALGDPSPLTHFWSLAIEEQFYLIWPPLLFAMVSMHVSKPNTRRVVLGLAAVSALAMMVLYNPAADPSRVYYGTDTRVFSLLLGAWMAFIPDRDLAPVRLAHRLGLDRLVSAAKRGKLDKNAKGGHGEQTDSAAETAPAQPSALTRFWSSPASIDVLGVVGLVALRLWSRSPTATPLSNIAEARCCAPSSRSWSSPPAYSPRAWSRALLPPSRSCVGKRSYSIYLWHYPLLLLMNPVANINDTPWWQYILQVLVVVAVAECCYRFIETPFRKGAFGRTVSEFRDGTATPASWVRAHIPVCATCGVVLIIALGGLIFVPETSALSGEGAEILNKEAKNTAPKDQQAADDTDKDNDGFPDGSYDLLMIGDSVSLRAVDSFDGVFPHSHIDAEKGRQFDAGRATFEGYLQQNLAGKVVVFALGTNGLVTDDQIDASWPMPATSVSSRL